MNCLVIKHPLLVSLYEVVDNTLLVAIKSTTRRAKIRLKLGSFASQNVILGVSVLS